MPNSILSVLRSFFPGLAVAATCLFVLVLAPTSAWAEDSTRVELVSAGAKPHEVMTYWPDVGVTQHAAMTMKLSNSVTVGGQTMPSAGMPGFRFTMSAVAAKGATDDVRAITARFIKIDVLTKDDDPMGAMLQPMMDSLNGLTMAYDVTKHGEARNVKISGNESNPMLAPMMVQMRKNVDQMTTMLPKEPIGLGGVWKLHQTVTNEGITLKQVATYKVVAREGNTYQCDVNLVQTADPQEIKNPNLPAGTIMTLQSMKGTASGKLSLDMSRPLPTLTLRVASDLVSSVNAGGQSQELSVRTEVDLQIADVASTPITPSTPATPATPEVPAPTDDAVDEQPGDDGVAAQIASTRAQLQMRMFSDAIANYRLVNRGTLPPTLEALLKKPEGSPSAYLDEIPTDPWGHAYTYKVVSSKAYEIRSAGPDGQAATADDVIHSSN